MAISYKLFKDKIYEVSLKITLLELLPHVPGDNGLTVLLLWKMNLNYSVNLTEARILRDNCVNMLVAGTPPTYQ